ncbi:MAG: toast rack family protein [Leptolinea sp.]
MKTKILTILVILTITSLACSFTIQTPQMKTGPETTTTIDELYPSVIDIAHLTLEMGAGTLNIGEGGKKLVEGNITTNVLDWKPEVTRSDNNISISQGKQANKVNIPTGDLRNKWDLQLGTEKPISLEINAGAYKSDVVFGKVAIAELKINDGASQSKITFDEVNPQTMNNFAYKTGASQVNLINLANANFEEMTFESGAGSYTLDFNGVLQRDAKVTIKSGLSNIKIIMPSDTACTISLTGGVTNVSLKGTWTVNSNRYTTQVSSGPTLNINIEMGVGNLELISLDANSL